MTTPLSYVKSNTLLTDYKEFTIFDHVQVTLCTVFVHAELW